MVDCGRGILPPEQRRIHLSTRFFCESVVEDACLSWAEEISFQVVAGPTIAPGEPAAERTSYDQTILEGRLRAALKRLNPSVPADCLDDVVRRLERQELPSLVQSNRLFHRWLVSGFPVEYQRTDGSIKGDLVHLVDFDHPDANDWLAVNQFTVVENKVNRRADVVLFVNGLPLVVMELKNPADENATIWTAFNQLQTYKKQIPSLMRFNEALVISDGTEARIGSLTADKERFMRWRTIEGEQLAPESMPQLEVLIKGALDKRRFLDIVRSFVVFEDGDGDPIKILAAYHQYHAVLTAVEHTIGATRALGDKRCGVVWHTQGSGKSLTMAFYAGRIIAHPAMDNPTIVVLTDRNDLDDQLIVQIVAVREDDDGRVVHGRVRDDASGVESHGQALARTLRVPHDAAPLVAQGTCRPNGVSVSYTHL